MQFNPIGKRKFIVALVVVLCNAALAAAGVIEGAVYSSVALATVGAYLTANVAAKRTGDKNAEAIE